MTEINLEKAKCGQIWRDTKHPDEFWRVDELRQEMRPVHVVFRRTHGNKNKLDMLEIPVTTGGGGAGRGGGGLRQQLLITIAIVTITACQKAPVQQPVARTTIAKEQAPIVAPELNNSQGIPDCSTAAERISK